MEKLASSEIPARVFRKTGKRRKFRKDGYADAAELIGDLADGDEICGVTNGQFSLVDILRHVLTQTGPADVVISTWTMGIYDAEKAYAFVNDRLIRSIRFILDPSMFSRKPEIAAVLVQGFGKESFRPVNSHAKFCTVRSDSMAVCIRSSMNLNANNRLESFDISVCAEMTAFFEGIADDVWAKCDADNRGQSVSLFDDLLNGEAVKNPRRVNPFLAQA